jgi:hypothetical protein
MRKIIIAGAVALTLLIAAPASATVTERGAKRTYTVFHCVTMKMWSGNTTDPDHGIKFFDEVHKLQSTRTLHRVRVAALAFDVSDEATTVALWSACTAIGG